VAISIAEQILRLDKGSFLPELSLPKKPEKAV
jgi:hypothetical protein